MRWVSKVVKHVQPKLKFYMSLDELQIEEEVKKLKKPPKFLAKSGPVRDPADF